MRHRAAGHDPSRLLPFRGSDERRCLCRTVTRVGGIRSGLSKFERLWLSTKPDIRYRRWLSVDPNRRVSKARRRTQSCVLYRVARKIDQSIVAPMILGPNLFSGTQISPDVGRAAPRALCTMCGDGICRVVPTSMTTSPALERPCENFTVPNGYRGSSAFVSVAFNGRLGPVHAKIIDRGEKFTSHPGTSVSGCTPRMVPTGMFPPSSTMSSSLPMPSGATIRLQDHQPAEDGR
jgi:hypothetical protein